MPRQYVRHSILILATSLLLAACGASTPAANVQPTSQPQPTAAEVDPTKAPEAEPTKAAEAEPTKAAEAEPTKAAEAEPTKPAAQANATPGSACVGTFGYGITCLSDSGWQTFTDDESGIGSDLVSAMAVCPDTRLLALTSSGVSEYDGSAWKQLPEWGTQGGEAVTCGPDNQIWVAHFEGASRFVDGKWETFSSKEFATGSAANDLVEDVAVAADGTVWVATANSVASYDGSKWSVYQEGQGFEEQFFFDAITVDSQGRPWAAHSGGVVSFDGKEWTAYDNDDFITVESIAIDPEGKVWVGTFSSGAFVFDGQSWQSYDSKNSKLSSNHVRAIAFDGQGRAWLGTEWGLNVFDGASWQSYHMHTADLAGNNIYSIVTTDGGPALPALVEKSVGSLIGEVEREGEGPLANTAVEVCVESLGFSFSGDTPCSGQPFVQGAKTDDQGKFTITDLPAGHYILTVQTGDGKWAQLTGDFGITEKIPVAPGEETDLNTLTVKKEST